MPDSTTRQLGALLFCGLSIPAVMQFPSMHPATVCVAAGLAFWIWGNGTQKGGFGLAITSMFALAIVLGWAREAYPSAENKWLVSLMLFAIAIYAARNGIKPLLRVTAIFFFFVLLIYVVVIAFGLSDLSKIRAIEAPMRLDCGLIWLLLPLTATKTTKRWRYPWLAICVLPSLTCWLSLSVATDFPFYTLTKSISVLGVMERFEVVLSAALTAGLFALMGWFAHLIRENLSQCGIQGRKIYLGIFAPALIALCPQTFLSYAFAVLATIYWLILPLMAQYTEYRKKLKKC